jgi:YD repeat-containing protein
VATGAGRQVKHWERQPYTLSSGPEVRATEPDDRSSPVFIPIPYRSAEAHIASLRTVESEACGIPCAPAEDVERGTGGRRVRESSQITGEVIGVTGGKPLNLRLREEPRSMQLIQTQDLGADTWADFSEHLRTGHIYALKWDRQGKLVAIAGPFGHATEAVDSPLTVDWRTGADLDWATQQQWRQIAVLQEPKV